MRMETTLKLPVLPHTSAYMIPIIVSHKTDCLISGEKLKWGVYLHMYGNEFTICFIIFFFTF